MTILFFLPFFLTFSFFIMNFHSSSGNFLVGTTRGGERGVPAGVGIVGGLCGLGDPWFLFLSLEILCRPEKATDQDLYQGLITIKLKGGPKGNGHLIVTEKIIKTKGGGGGRGG